MSECKEEGYKQGTRIGKRENQSGGRMTIKGSKVCDVGRVLVIEGSLICFFICVRV